MKLHIFNLKPNGLIRVAWHLAAGFRLCGGKWGLFREGIPESINSMTTANNFWKVLEAMAPPRTILDVGANVSQMARLLMMKLSSEPKLLSFEPNPGLKPKGRVFHLALGDRDGSCEFFLPSDSTWGTVVKDKAADWSKQTLTVPMRRFDSLLASKEIVEDELEKPILLKIDTEGFELSTLRGFGEFLHKVDYLLIEITNAGTKLQSRSAFKIYNHIAAYGFNASKILYAGHDGSILPDYTDVLFWRDDALGA